MKIIKDGTKGIKICCSKCKSELEYNKDDVKEWRGKTSCNRLCVYRKSRKIYEYKSYWYEYTELYIECPVCGSSVIVDKKASDMGADTWDEEKLASDHHMSVKQFRKYVQEHDIYTPVKIRGV